MESKMTGQCLCGKVRFSAIPKSDHMDACHCSMCRKWSGGVLFATTCVDLKIENEEELQAYRSSPWGERHFCKTCGSSLFWRMADRSLDVVMVSAFDDPSPFEFQTEMFIDKKPANYAFANDTKKITAKEFMAMYSGEEPGADS